MPVGVVVTGNLLVVPGRHFFLRHFPAARCHLNVVRAHFARAHKSLLEHGSDHVSDAPEREQTISRLSECGNRSKSMLRGCYMAPTARSRFAVTRTARNEASPQIAEQNRASAERANL